MAKKKKKAKKKPGDVSADEFFEASDGLVQNLEIGAELSKAEVAPMRLQLIAGARLAGGRALAGMQTAKIGRTRVLVPTAKNSKLAAAATERTRERFSRFSLGWLSPKEAKRLIADGEFDFEDRQNFIRHSNRLARSARLFLNQIAELEPSLQEEVDATLRQIDDARNDLTKLEVRSWTNLNETLLRNINGRQTRAAAGADVKTYDLNQNLYNLSLLEHPKAVVREILANSSTKMAARSVTDKSLTPQRALVFAAAGPDAVSKMTPGSRTSSILWRMFTAKELDQQYAKLNANRQATSSFRGLGLSYNTPEWYIPVPPEIADDVRAELKSRRKGFLARLKDQGQTITRTK